jgi:hypothetical protein
VAGSAAEPIPNFRGKEQAERGGRKKREEKSTTTMREKERRTTCPGRKARSRKKERFPSEKEKNEEKIKGVRSFPSSLMRTRGRGAIA